MTVNYLLMDNRIRMEKQDKPNDQVKELILDHCKASHISGLTEEFINLEALSIIDVGLVTLKGFPKLPNLKRLELCDNRLSDSLEFLLACPRIQELNLSGNNFKNLGALEPLKHFRNLINLDLFNCEITRSADYRQKVFDMLPNLQLLDGFERTVEKEPPAIQSPPEQANVTTEENVEVSTREEAGRSMKEDTSMVDVENITTCPTQQDTTVAEESMVSEENVGREEITEKDKTTAPADDKSPVDNENVIREISSPAKDETPMEAENNNEQASCSPKEDVPVAIETCENTGPTEKEKITLEVDNMNQDNCEPIREGDVPETTECIVEEVKSPTKEDNSASIAETEHKMQEDDIEINENDEGDVADEERGNSPIVEESERQDSVIEISADHDTSNDEDAAESSENPQEISFDEEEEDQSSEYSYTEEGELEEGECLDGEEDEEDDELNETYTRNETAEISSEEEEEQESEAESGEILDESEMDGHDSGEQQEESSQVLQELSGMQPTCGESQDESVEVQTKEEGGGEEQSGDVEKL